ncbi:MAG: hypothetical protein JSW30_02690, partial [Dehalococcoidia bacterium]
MSGHLVRRQKETTNREQAASAKTVGSIVTQALKNSTKKMGVANTKALIARMKEGDPVAFKYCNYTIAKQVGEMLGLLDKNIKAVYVCEYDDATPEDACFCEARKPVSLLQLII